MVRDSKIDKGKCTVAVLAKQVHSPLHLNVV